MATAADISAETRSPRAGRKETFAAWRQREVIAREFAPLPAEEVAGRRFAERVTRSLADAPSVSLQEWRRLYRLVVPRTPNGKAGPRPLEEAWRARRLKAEGRTRREIAVVLGYITPAHITAAETHTWQEAPVANAEKRVSRNERLLRACEDRIAAAGERVPAWLQPGRA